MNVGTCDVDVIVQYVLSYRVVLG